MNAYDQTVQTARDYYNSPDADTFYHRIWGGEDIHIGLYESEEEAIADASRRTVACMGDRLNEPKPGTRVLDLGAGYGGSARYLAETFGCEVVALNLSEVENERDREINASRGLGDKIRVVDGSFENVDEPDASFDVVWSQDAFLHSGERARVIAEAARVLKPGGMLIFTDPMQSDDAPDGDLLQPVLDRIHLDTLGSPNFYRAAAQSEGLEEVGFEDYSDQLVRHYSRVLATLEAHAADLKDEVSDDYIQRMRTGLQHWINAGKAGHLVWGVFRFRKPG